MDTTCFIANRLCLPCEGGIPALSQEAARERLATLDDWQMSDGKIGKTFRFANHFEAMAFVNALAWISHRENHHPEVTLGYADCQVRYWTHAIDGLSENDFICARKVEALLKL